MTNRCFDELLGHLSVARQRSNIVLEPFPGKARGCFSGENHSQEARKTNTVGSSRSSKDRVKFLEEKLPIVDVEATNECGPNSALDRVHLVL